MTAVGQLEQSQRMGATRVVRRSPARYRRGVKRALITVIAWLFGITCLVPLIWMVLSSFKPDMDIVTPPVTWFPANPTLINYKAVFDSQLGTFMLNSTVVAALRVIGDLVTATLAGYAFARMTWRGRGSLFLLYLATIAIPYQLLLIPRFVQFREMHLYNTLWTLVLPGAFTAFGAFVMRQFFMSIPQEYIDSARVDGANQLTTLRRIVVPLALPAIVSLAMVDFIWSWNDYETPLVMISSLSRYTLPLGLTTYNSSLGGGLSPGPVLAASVIGLLPIAVLFIVLQKRFQKALLGSGVKG